MPDKIGRGRQLFFKQRCRAERERGKASSGLPRDAMVSGEGDKAVIGRETTSTLTKGNQTGARDMGGWVKRCWCVLLLLWTAFHLGVNAAQETVESVAPPAELKVANRSIITFRASLLGEAPAVRAQRAQAVINELLKGTEDPVVRLDTIQDSYLVLYTLRNVWKQWWRSRNRPAVFAFC